MASWLTFVGYFDDVLNWSFESFLAGSCESFVGFFGLLFDSLESLDDAFETFFGGTLSFHSPSSAVLRERVSAASVAFGVETSLLAGFFVAAATALADGAGAAGVVGGAEGAVDGSSCGISSGYPNFRTSTSSPASYA